MNDHRIFLKKRFEKAGAKVIMETAPAKCDLCGKEAELRPYGPNGENICHPCGKKNPAATERAMARYLKG